MPTSVYTSSASLVSSPTLFTSDSPSPVTAEETGTRDSVTTLRLGSLPLTTNETGPLMITGSLSSAQPYQLEIQ